MKIPFNKPNISRISRMYLEDAIASDHYSGDGPYTKRCHLFFQQLFGVKKALLTTSCTHALEMCALLLDIKAGDEVIVPSFTFVSTANAFALRGARLVFADIKPDTLNLNEKILAGLITDKTKAIVVVHYAGVGCEMDDIMAIANSRGIPVIEDNAHGLFGKYKGRWLGTFGAFATQSFHETKNFTCGEGGALLINDERYIERAEIIREKGTNRSKYFRGEVDKYTWVDIGSSYLPSDLLAAILFGQLESWVQIQNARKAVWARYFEGLAAWANQSHVSMPHCPQYCDQAWHMFYLMMPDAERQQALLQHLNSNGYRSVFHYVPLHSSPFGRAHGSEEFGCPYTVDVSARLLRLPFYCPLDTEIQDRIIACVTAFG